MPEIAPTLLPGRRTRGPAAVATRTATLTPPADRIIVKLRSTQPAIKLLAKAMETGTTVPSVLQDLQARGYLRRVQPILPRKGVGPGVGAALFAAATEARETKRSGHALVSVTAEPSVSPRELAEFLATHNEVEYAYVPAVKHYAAVPATGADPLASRQWSHAAISLHQARQATGFVEADDVVVAVVDSGVDEDHPDLAASIASYVNYIATEDKRDIVGHGTHVAGIVAAEIGNATGIGGICRARLMMVKGLPHPDGDYDPDEYYRALAHPIDAGASVINLSLGGGYDAGERDIIDDALAAGVVVVAAMGNEYEKGNPISYPAAYPGVIAVGASDEADRRASFSNTGNHIDLVAPGVDIISTVPRYPSYFSTATDYDAWDGTSMATPHVAAAAALYLAKNGSASPAEVERALRKAADPVQKQKGHDERYGTGRLNVERLLR